MRKITQRATKIKEIQGEANKHLTLEQRSEIQDCLAHGMTFKAIAGRIAKSQTTVSREVKQRFSVQDSKCKEDQPKPCQKLLKAPFVCNGCDRRSRCRLEKHMYYARYAHEEYKSILTETRTGIALGKEAFYIHDAILKAGIEKGQHVYQIIKSNNMDVSVPTVYRYIHQGYSAVSAIDLPRAVKFKPRKVTPKDCIPSSIKKGRTYDCFKDYIDNHQINQWLEMDTVIGRPGGKVILTFATSNPSFMFARLADDKSAVSISAQIQFLKERLIKDKLSFGNLFPVVLTDNGGEFANVFSVENDPDGKKETDLFFCDPYASYQKPHVEKGHTLLRDILPKGSSFDDLTQEKIDLIFSHINGVLRKDLGGKSPFDLFAFLHGLHVTNALGISRISPTDIIQSPALLK